MDDFRLKQNVSGQFGQNKPRPEGLNVPQKLGQAVVEEQQFQENLSGNKQTN